MFTYVLLGRLVLVKAPYIEPCVQHERSQQLLVPSLLLSPYIQKRYLTDNALTTLPEGIFEPLTTLGQL